MSKKEVEMSGNFQIYDHEGSPVRTVHGTYLVKKVGGIRVARNLRLQLVKLKQLSNNHMTQGFVLASAIKT